MKKLSLLFMLLLVCALVFSGCGKEEKPYDYDLSEYVTLGQFPNVEIDKDEIDKKVDEAVNEITSQYAEENEITDRAVENGDTVNISYVGKIDGEEFEGGSSNGTDLTIGSKEFIDGFEDGLIGKNLGEEVELNLVFPEDYHNEDLSGKDVVFSVKINSIKAKVNPELTDDMVKEKTEYSTVAEYLEEKEKEITKEQVQQNYIDSCKMLKYPQTETKKYYDQMVNSYNQVAVLNGMTLESIAMSYYGYSSLDEFLEYVMQSAMLTVKEEIVIWKTVRDNNISFTDEEYQTRALELAKKAQMDTVKEYEEYAGKNTVELQIYLDKIVEMACEAKNYKNTAE